MGRKVVKPPRIATSIGPYILSRLKDTIDGQVDSIAQATLELKPFHSLPENHYAGNSP